MKKFLVIGFLALIMSGIISGCSQSEQGVAPLETFSMTSSVLNEKRTITVWYPDDYATRVDSLPVLYLLDGGAKEDFAHVAQTVSELIESKKMRAVLLVGIENTQRRRDFTGPTLVKSDLDIAPKVGESAAFRRFLQTELLPQIQQKYRVTNERGLIGESLAGLFVVETFLKTPELFTHYIAFDPSLWWNNQALVRESESVLKNQPENNQTLWIASSDATDIVPYTTALANSLQNFAQTQLKWHYSPMPKEQHATVFRAAKKEALLWTYGSELDGK